MTPTEQDKKIIRGIEKALEKSFSYQVLVLNKEYCDGLVQLITADRKRVALEARIDEIEHIAGFTHGMTNQMFKNLQNRIAELKAQQEEI